MAILALAKDLFDLRARLGRIVVATTRDGKAVTTEDLGVAGAMTVLLRDAIKPNLLQTLEGGPAYVHCGPVRQHRPRQQLDHRRPDRPLDARDIVVTEAGFGADMGAEKFFDIKCRASGLRPDAAVVVATIRALKMHGGVGRIVAGKPLDPALTTENVEAVRKGCANLAKHIEIVARLRRPGRRRDQRLPDRHAGRVRGRSARSRSRRAPATRSSRPTSPRAARAPRRSRPPSGRPPRRTAARSTSSTRTRCRSARRSRRSPRKVYGAAGVDFAPAATKALAEYEALGYGHLPICMAKTHLSLSHDPNLKGRPTGFRFPVREVRLAAGAGFIYPLARRHADDAGPAQPPGRREDRHRRRRERRRALLIR